MKDTSDKQRNKLANDGLLGFMYFYWIRNACLLQLTIYTLNLPLHTTQTKSLKIITNKFLPLDWFFRPWKHTHFFRPKVQSNYSTFCEVRTLHILAQAITGTCVGIVCGHCAVQFLRHLDDIYAILFKHNRHFNNRSQFRTNNRSNPFISRRTVRRWHCRQRIKSRLKTVSLSFSN